MFCSKRTKQFEVYKSLEYNMLWLQKNCNRGGTVMKFQTVLQFLFSFETRENKNCLSVFCCVGFYLINSSFCNFYQHLLVAIFFRKKKWNILNSFVFCSFCFISVFDWIELFHKLTRFYFKLQGNTFSTNNLNLLINKNCLYCFYFYVCFSCSC